MAFRNILDYRTKCSLKDNNYQRLTVSYVYEKGQTILQAIHESSESNKSEESSDSEKKGKETPPPVIEKNAPSEIQNIISTNKNESVAKELLEQKVDRIAQEYCCFPCEEDSKLPTSDDPMAKMSYPISPPTVPVNPVQTNVWCFQYNSPRLPSPSEFMNTMPLPTNFLLDMQNPSLNSTTQLRPNFSSFVNTEKKESFSEISVNSDTLSEGPKINCPPRFPTGFQYSHSPVFFHTESTANVDSDEALSSSGKIDRDSFVSSSSAYYSGNPQLLRTQPIKKPDSTVPMHTHTKSYDFDHMSQFQYPAQNPYFMQPQYSYYQAQYYDYPAEYVEPMVEQQQLYQPTFGMHFGTMKGAGRKRNPEKEEERGMFTILLENILYKRDARTTVMIKNIPNKYNQKMLLSEIDEKHKGQYDFFYLPIDFQNKCNVGYAFINFVNPIYILGFFERYNGRKWEKFNSEKVFFLTTLFE